MLTERGVGNIVHEFSFDCKGFFKCIASNISLNSCNSLLGTQFVGDIKNANSQTSLWYAGTQTFCFTAPSSIRILFTKKFWAISYFKAQKLNIFQLGSYYTFAFRLS